MKRLLMCAVSLAAVALAVAVFLVNPPVEAKKGFDNGDLDGVYAWVNTEIRLEAGVTEYCSGYGTIEFFGDGTASAESTHRCAAGVVSSDFRRHDYAVDPDGQFLLWEHDSPAYQTHCRLLDKGSMILCDGTASHPDELSMIAIAVKQ